MKPFPRRLARLAAGLFLLPPLLLSGGCTALTVASAAVSVTGTAVSAGITVGKAAVGTVAMAAKGGAGLVTGNADDVAH